jgi:hypothetical protein
MELSFQDIERILGKKLPRSAHEYRAWWSNDPTKPQSSAWLDEEWRTTSLSMTEQRLSFVRTNDREDAYISFFASLNKALEQRTEFPLQGASPQGQNWMVLASFDWTGPYSAMVIAAFARRRRFRVELYLDSGDKEKNKRRFDDLFAHKGMIESAIREPLEWERLDEKRACRVAVYTKAYIHVDKNNPILLDWAVRHTLDLYRAFQTEFLAGPTARASSVSTR